MNDKAILLVEDNPDDELLTIRGLKKSKVMNEIVVARDGAAAIALFEPGARFGEELPQIVLLDLKLPKLDGHEVLRRLRGVERTRHLPIVILTSSREEGDLVRGYEGGANAYVVKPVAFDEFCEAVGRLGLFWLLLNESPVQRAPASRS